MEYSVQQLAELAGLSARALRWYDQIGLLRPTRAENGYRRYGPAQVDRLQQILLFRQAGLELREIARLLDAPDHDPEAALAAHLALLREKRRALELLIDTTEKTLKSMRGELTMSDSQKFEGFKQKLVAENEEKYGEEVRRRWGNEAADASNARMMKMTEEQYKAFQALGEELNALLAKATAEGDAASPDAQRVAELHKKWLCFTWGEGKYSAEAHRNLTQMYLDDERFTVYYEKIAPGAATLLRDAVAIYTKGQ